VIVLPVIGVIQIGGLGILNEMLHQLNPEYLDPFSLGAGVIIGFLGIGLGSPGQPHIVVRYMSISDPARLKYSAIYGTFWNIVLGLGAICIGLVGRILVPDINSLPDSDPEMIYLALSSEYFGPVLYGLLVGGVFAAILSTADSQLLVVASTFARDLYEKVIAGKREIDEKKKLYLSRVVLVLSGILALFLPIWHRIWYSGLCCLPGAGLALLSVRRLSCRFSGKSQQKPEFFRAWLPAQSLPLYGDYG
jgi:solute:Na+ symporter, SSS family